MERIIKMSAKDFNREFYNWTLANSGIRLRNYQLKACYPIYKAVVLGTGEEFVVSFPRQSGKTTFIGCLFHYMTNTLPSDYEWFNKGFWIGHFGPTKEQISTLFRDLKGFYETKFQRLLLNTPVEMSNAQNFELGNKAWIRARTANITAKIESLTVHMAVLEESQDIPFIRKLKSIYPMCATTGGPKIHIGTMNPENTIKNIEDEEEHFSSLINKLPSRNRFVITDKEVLAECNDFWKAEYQRNMDWLGKEHPLFRSQWCGERIEVDNRFIREGPLLELKKGAMLEKQWQKDCFLGFDTGKLHDSTVLAVWDSTPALINWCEFLPGVDYDTQFNKSVEFLKDFKIVKFKGDYYNAGEALADRLKSEGYDGTTIKMNDETRSIIYTEYEIACKQHKFIYPNNHSDTTTRFENQMKTLRRRYRGRIMVVAKPKKEGSMDDYPDASASGWNAYQEWYGESHTDISSLGGGGRLDRNEQEDIKTE